MTYAFSIVCMFAVPGRTNPPNSGVVGFGHGIIRGPAILGDFWFATAIPILALIPAAVVALPFRLLYRRTPVSKSNVTVNFMFLTFGFIAAIINASIYRGD